MKKTIIIFLFALLASCKGVKVVSSDIRSTDSVRIKDSVVIRLVTHSKDSTVIKDTLIRVKYDRAQYSFDANDTKDTAIKSGRATIRKTVNNGIVTVQADCDSFDILINDQRIIIQQKNIENERISSEFAEYKKSHSETTVKEVKQGFLYKWFGYLKNAFALFGLVCLVWWVVKKVF